MLKHLQRVNKEAFKFQFTISYRELVLDCYNKWYPKTVHISWSRREKNLTTKTHPVIADPDVSQRFLLTWSIPENQVAVVTLFRASSSAFFEPKHWVFEVYEGEQLLGTQRINLSENASTIPKQLDLKIDLTPSYCELKQALLHLTISSSLIRHGKATDDDQLSISSFQSMSKVRGDSDDDLGGSSVRRSKSKGHMFRSFRVKKNKTQPFNPHVEAVNSVAGRYNLVKHLDEYETSFGAERSPMKGSQCKKPNSPTPSSPLSSLSSLNPFSSSSLSRPPPSLSSSSSSKPPLSSSSTPMTDPSEELLAWCRLVTTDHHLTTPLDNLTTAWRNGLAFCAIIHHFKPHLIDYDSLDPSDISGNCKIAFDAGESLGVPRVMQPEDLVLLKVPDKLSIATYLFQLKSFFSPSSLPQPFNSKKRVPHHFKFSFNVDKKASPSRKSQPSFHNAPSAPIAVEVDRNKRNSFDNTAINNINNINDSNNHLKINSVSNNVKINSSNNSEKGILNLQSLSISEEDPLVITNTDLNIEDKIELPEKGEVDLKNPSLDNCPLKTPPSPSTSPLPRMSPPKPPIPPASPSSPLQSPSSPPSAHIRTSTRHKIMTRKQLYNPFDSDSDDDDDDDAFQSISVMDQPIPAIEDDDDDQIKDESTNEEQELKHNGTSPSTENSNATENDSEVKVATKSRQDVLRDRARSLMTYAGMFKNSPKGLFSRTSGGEDGNGLSEEGSKEEGGDEDQMRQKRLRQQARKMIAEVKKSPTEVHVIGGGGDDGGGKTDCTPQTDNNTRQSCDSNYYFNEYGYTEEAIDLKGDHSKEVLKDGIKSAVNAGETADSRKGDNKSLYLQREMEKVEREQRGVDEEAVRLERVLRTAIEDGNSHKEMIYLQEWFSLVSYKNALIQRQAQLDIERDEEDLERRFTFLSLELRNIMELAEWEKSDEVRGREKMLMRELVEMVDQRDEMVRRMDETEKAILLDQASHRSVEQKLISRQQDHNCQVM